MAEPGEEGGGEFSGWKVRSSKLVNGMDSPWDNDVKIVVDDGTWLLDTI